eukprot:TRINITY_DN2232_c0_g1_i1.p1 TRINITY_DN2232_c0_g1~~TRINITY_DN2232_c0_g1_i1.p1  ORF type:complete len:343 (+),score=65.89 TRINITY_DN2232_c0_g1_i1:209-1237(+)
MGLCAGSGVKDAQPTEPVRVLSLGIGGCGKTTFVRHMKIIHDIPLDDVETDRFIQTIRRNYLIVMGELLILLGKLKLTLSDDNQKHAATVKELLRNRDSSIHDNLDILKSLWADPVIQEVIKNNREQLNSPHISYFWDNVDRIMSDGYKPLEEDILKVRIRTAGAYSSLIYVKPEYFEFFDVGGQKPERQKWQRVITSHKFSCIIYFVATDEWDVPDEERDFECSKLEMSKIIFKEVANDDSIDKSMPIIIFLNRSDLLDARIASDSGYDSFKKTFPEYNGARTMDDAIEFIRKRFMDGVKREAVKFYVTNALDRNSMTPVFNAVKTYILTSSLKMNDGIDY